MHLLDYFGVVTEYTCSNSHWFESRWIMSAGSNIINNLEDRAITTKKLLWFHTQWPNFTSSAQGVNFKKLDNFCSFFKMFLFIKRTSFLMFTRCTELEKLSQRGLTLNWLQSLTVRRKNKKKCLNVTVFNCFSVFNFKCFVPRKSFHSI